MSASYLKYIVGTIAIVVIIFLTTQMSPLGPEKTKILDGGGGKIEDISYLPKGYLVIEAENAIKIEPPVMVSDKIKDASFGKSLYIGPEKVNENPKIEKYSRGYMGASHPGYAEYEFTAPASALYSVWVRVRWSNDCGDSIDLCFGDNFFATIQGNSSKYNPQWIWLKAGSNDFPVTKKLEKGKKYTFLICNREDDLYFDQILLIDSTSTFEPVGILK